MQTQLGRWKSGGCAPTGVGVDRRTPKGSGGSAFAPEEIGGEANEKQNDGGGEIHEVRRVAEGKVDGVADDGGGGEAVEDPADKNHTFDQFAESAQLTSTHQNCRPYSESNDGCCRSLKARVHLREFHEKEFVFGHCVKNARGGEDHAIGGAESGNQNGERHDLACPRAEDGGYRGGRDGFARCHVCGAKGEEVSDNGDEIEPHENQ